MSSLDNEKQIEVYFSADNSCGIVRNRSSLQPVMGKFKKIVETRNHFKKRGDTKSQTSRAKFKIKKIWKNYFFRIPLGLTIIALCFSFANAQTDTLILKKRIAVLEFKNKATSQSVQNGNNYLGYSSGEASANLTDMLITELVKTGKYIRPLA